MDVKHPGHCEQCRSVINDLIVRQFFNENGDLRMGHMIVVICPSCSHANKFRLIIDKVRLVRIGSWLNED